MRSLTKQLIKQINFGKTSIKRVSFQRNLLGYNNFSTQNQNPKQNIQNDDIFDENCSINDQEVDKQQIKYDEEIFQTREQQISVQLLNSQSANDVIKTYKLIKEKHDGNLTANELGLCFYFICFYKGQNLKSHLPIIKEILVDIQSKIKKMEDAYFINFVSSLGMLVFHTGNLVTLDNQFRDMIGEQIKMRHLNFDLKQVSSLTFATTYLLNHDIVKLHEIVTCLCNLQINNIETIDTPELLNYFVVFAQSRYQNFDIVKPFVDAFQQVAHNFSQDELTRVIMILDDIQYISKDKELMKDLIDLSTSFDLTIDNASQMIFIVSQNLPDELEQIKELFKIVHQKNAEMNITHYVNLWLALGRLNKHSSELEKSINVLKRLINNSNIFQMKDFENFEVVNILVACSTLKINDQEFIGNFVEFLKPRLNYLDKDEILNLGRCFITYVRQFEDFYIEVHDVCEKQISSFNEQEKQLLSKTFQKVKVLFPHSQFIEGTLY